MSTLSLLVLAAGMGSRYGGLKQLDPMGPSGETLLDYSVFDALQSGFNRVVFLIRKDIEQEFRSKIGTRYEGRVEVAYAFQELDALPDGHAVPEGRQKPWGTAHAIWCARNTLTGPFVAINADDFYGRPAYDALGRFLQAGPADGTRFAMAGYRLDKTLSENGSVARGVCQVDESGLLHTITENTGIEHRDGRIFQKTADGTEQTFCGNETVSMNFWGLTPAVFPLLEKEIRTFLQTQSADPKAECYIPMAIGAMIARGEATLTVLPTDSTWFGVTYREDKPRVTDALARLHSEGTYPSPLWA